MKRTITIAALFGWLIAIAAPGIALAQDVEKGKQLFITNCASCHGNGGKGDGPVGKVLQPPPRDFTVGDFKFDTDGDGKAGEDADLMNVLKKGAGAYGGSQMMAPWPALNDEQLNDIIAYIRSLKQ